MSSFDKETFLATHVEGAMEVKFTPLPVGDYQAYIDDIDAGEIGDSPVLYVSYAIIDETAKAFMKMDKPLVRDTVFLDFEPDGRLSLGVNKNVKLGAIRDATGQNKSGPWNPNMLRGAGPVMLKLGHRFNKKTGEGPYANVERIAAKR